MAEGRDVRSWLEIATTIGVILSLVFVGFEIRQNTQAVRGATIEALAAQSIEFVTGGDVDPAAVLTSIQKADMSFRMMMQIRNKLMEAYQEIKDMRI